MYKNLNHDAQEGGEDEFGDSYTLADYEAGWKNGYAAGLMDASAPRLSARLRWWFTRRVKHRWLMLVSRKYRQAMDEIPF